MSSTVIFHLCNFFLVFNWITYVHENLLCNTNNDITTKTQKHQKKNNIHDTKRYFKLIIENLMASLLEKIEKIYSKSKYIEHQK